MNNVNILFWHNQKFNLLWLWLVARWFAPHFYIFSSLIWLKSIAKLLNFSYPVHFRSATLEDAYVPSAGIFSEISIKLPRIRDKTFRSKESLSGCCWGVGFRNVFPPTGELFPLFLALRIGESTCIFSCHRIRGAIFFHPKATNHFPVDSYPFRLAVFFMEIHVFINQQCLLVGKLDIK